MKLTNLLVTALFFTAVFSSITFSSCDGGSGPVSSEPIDEWSIDDVDYAIITAFTFVSYQNTDSLSFYWMVRVSAPDGTEFLGYSEQSIEQIVTPYELPYELSCCEVDIPNAYLDQQLCIELVRSSLSSAGGVKSYGCATLRLSDYMDKDGGDVYVEIQEAQGLDFKLGVEFNW